MDPKTDGKIETLCATPKQRDSSTSFFHINRRTFPLKFTLFLYYGAMSAILPYLTIHMKDIGISLSQIAIIYAVLPFTAFLGPPILGFMADRMGQYKSVLIVATVINGLFHTLLLVVPKYSETAVVAPTVLEFNQFGGALLRPESVDWCDSFVLSLRSNRDGFRNKIIDIHSCTTSGDGSSSPHLRKREASPVSWGIPSLFCSMTPTDDDEIPILKCGRNETSLAEEDFDSFPSDILGSRTVGKDGGDSSKNCSIRVRINSQSESHKLGTLVCKTNFMFDTGEVIPHGNGSLTFWLYFVLRIVANIFMNSCFSLLDATTLAVVGDNEGSEYGRERILCTLGYAIVSPLAGLLVDTVSTSKGYVDYSSAFYFSNVLLILNVLGYFFMKLNIEKPEENVWKNAADLLNYPEVVVFLWMIFVLGNMWGFVESYLFIFLDELAAPKYLLGLTLTVGSLAGIPFLYGAEKLVAKAGRVNIIVLAYLVYFLRFFGYSYIPNPFWCFPFEAMEAFTYHLMWVAAATYCAILAPKGLLATLMGVMGSLHYGLGKGSGAFIGGYVINLTNTRMSFRYFGIAAGAVGIVYFLINKFYLEGAIARRLELEESAKAEIDQDFDTKHTNSKSQSKLDEEQREVMLSKKP